ncbi:MAG TPA: hypothetical protein VNM90_14420 [Haliangium sp.]|nr:hypothetical protein [Haliangium sp.]
MNTSIRLISSVAIFGLGLSGLVGCDGEVTTEEDIQPVEEAQADETALETQDGEASAGERARTEPASEPEEEPVEPDVIVDEAPLVNVLNVTCMQPEDPEGMDEPMIVINGKQAWLGAGFVAGTTDAVRYESIAFDSVATIELWEVDVWDDFTDPNDLLGFVEVQASAMGDGPQIDTVEAKGVKYEIAYQVERCTGCSPGDSPEGR